MDTRPDNIDKLVFMATLTVRQQYKDACKRLNLQPRELSPVTLMQRSVR